MSLTELDAKLGIGKNTTGYWSKGYALETYKPAILKPVRLEERLGDNTLFAKFPTRTGYINWVKSYVKDYDQHSKVKERVLSFLESLTSGHYEEKVSKDVRKNVLNAAVKMGINAGTSLYDTYKYSLHGSVIDPARLAQGNPECYIVPKNERLTVFYEIFVNISVPAYVSDGTMEENAELLVTALSMLEEVSNFKIQYKVTLIDISENWLRKGSRPMVVSVPLYAHNDNKSPRVLKSMFSHDSLRGVLFMHQDAVAKDIDDEVRYNRGRAVALNSEDNAISLWQFDVKDLFARVVNDPFIKQHIPELLK